MKRFQFRLEPILHYRRYLEKRAQIALVNAKAEQGRRAREAQRLVQVKAGAALECRREGEQGIPAAKYQIHQNYLKKMERDIKGARQRLEEGKRAVETETGLLQEATRHKRVLELYRDQQLETHSRETAQEEQKTLDELVLMKRGEPICD